MGRIRLEIGVEWTGGSRSGCSIIHFGKHFGGEQSRNSPYTRSIDLTDSFLANWWSNLEIDFQHDSRVNVWRNYIPLSTSSLAIVTIRIFLNPTPSTYVNMHGPLY